MTTLLSQPVFSLYAAACSALIVILYGLGFYTAKVRADRRVVVNHEDAGINRNATIAEVDHPDVQRIKRAHQNSLENAVPFFVIGFLYSQTAAEPKTAMALFGVFVGIRLLHATFYLMARQPYRTLAFVVGALINLAMVVQVARALM